jgi:hypothetical protein
MSFDIDKDQSLICLFALRDSLDLCLTVLFNVRMVMLSILIDFYGRSMRVASYWRSVFVNTAKASFVFSVVVLATTAARGQNALDNSSKSPIDLIELPDEFLVARVPGLGPVYGARASWAIWRAPYIWTNDQLIDLSRVKLPQWDKAQVPIALVPADGTQRAVVVLENEAGKTLEEVPLENPFLPDRYDSARPRPTRYRIRLDLSNGRATLQTPSYPWLTRKNVVECDYEIEQGKDAMTDGRVKTCLSTLESIALNADRQWFATVTWPETGNAIRRNAMSTRDRELKASFRKTGHVYENQRKGRRFVVRAGITNIEQTPNIDFDYNTIPKFETIQFSASREEKARTLYEAKTASKGSLTLRGFASDTVEQLAVRSAQGPNPRLHLQFVGSTETQPSIFTTEYLENRTGIPGLLRRWRGRGFLNQNQLISSRGEQEELLGGPGIDLAYAMKFWSLEPYAIFDSGLFHPNSKISISELQVGVRRNFSFMPSWSTLYLGLHQYQLSGRNPGSTRLGTSDAVAIGVAGLQRIGRHYLQGRGAGLISSAGGFDAQIEYGQIWNRKSDFHLTWGIFLGVSRYSSRVVIPSNLRVENLSEDRVTFGVSFGFLGPESQHNQDVSSSETPQ